MRSLSYSQAEEAEKVRFGVLCNLEPFSKVDAESIMQALADPIPQEAMVTYLHYEAQAMQELDLALLSVDQRNNIRSYVYAALYTQDQVDNSL